MENYDPKDILLFALNHFDIKINSYDGKMVNLDMEYVIEIEDNNLFKLLQGGQVVAPFTDIEELCRFIKTDMQLNEKN
jgi:hypothetical protein